VKSAEAAQRKVIAAWGAERYGLAARVRELLLDAALDRIGGAVGERVLAARALLTRIAPSLRELVRIAGTVKVAAEPLMPGDMRELASAVLALQHAHGRAAGIASSLEQKARILVGSAGEHGTGRVELVRCVLARDAAFPTSASEWAYFAIAVGLDEPAPDSAAFQATHRKRWDEGIRAGKTGSKQSGGGHVSGKPDARNRHARG